MWFGPRQQTPSLHQSYQQLLRKGLLSEKQEKGGTVCSHVWISEQLGNNEGEAAEGSTGLDLKAEDCGAWSASCRRDAPQDGVGEEYPICSQKCCRQPS